VPHFAHDGWLLNAIAAALREPSVRGVLVCSHDLVRRHRDHVGVLPVLVYRLTGSAAEVAVLTVLETGPYIVFGLFAGHLLTG